MQQVANGVRLAKLQAVERRRFRGRMGPDLQGLPLRRASIPEVWPAGYLVPVRKCPAPAFAPRRAMSQLRSGHIGHSHAFGQELAFGAAKLLRGHTGEVTPYIR